MRLIHPPSLKIGDVIGVFTPSWPANVILREKYELGLSHLEKLGYKVKEGLLTKKITSQGYRSGSPKERANEFMDLILDKEVKCIISVIGGHNSSSLLPYLDFEAIRLNPKIICGYSDVTALELGILKMSGLCCFYGPAIVPSFGEPLDDFSYTVDSFIKSVTNLDIEPQLLVPPEKWSNHFINAKETGWFNISRIYKQNLGWVIQNPGFVEAPLLPVNLDTLLSIAGTKYFPDLENCILMIEEMYAPFDNLERNFSHLKLLGVFDKIAGLIFSKPENIDNKGADFNEIELLMDFLGKDITFPVISNFDCGHTYPMVTLQQMIKVRIDARKGVSPIIEILEPMVTK